MEMAAPNQLSLKNERPVEKDFLNEQNLMLITIEGWKRLVDTKTSWLSDIPSTLIISEEKNEMFISSNANKNLR